MLKNFWNHSVKVNLVSLLDISFHLFLTQTAAIFRVASEDILYKAAQDGRWIALTELFSTDIYQICGKKSRLAAVLSRNRFETYVFKLHIFNLNNETRRMRHSSAPQALLRTYRVFSLYVYHIFFFVIRKGSSYILKNAYRVSNIRKSIHYTFSKDMQCQNR